MLQYLTSITKCHWITYLTTDFIRMKRIGKFYFRNEKETLESLGFKQVPGSGNGWIAKEDGENEIALVQLKSTDANSYTLKQFDMKQLEYHAQVEHKVPIFLIQFLQQGKTYAVVNVENLEELTEAIQTGSTKERMVVKDEGSPVLRSKVTSASKSRKQFFEEKEKEHGRREVKHY